MKNRIVVAVVVVIVVGIVAAYFYWPQQQQQPEPVQVQAISPVAAPPEPVVQQVIETVLEQPQLPELSGSDQFMLDTLAGLVGNKSLMQLFHTERIIRKIVATVDNLPRERVPVSVMPVSPVPGAFITEGPEDGKTISPNNAARYATYVKVAEVIDAQKLVEVYVRLYPLFQQAYEELGYPKKYFNDRLLVAIDNMLAAPDLKNPIKLVQPHVLYNYANPDLEARSAGQKVLMRVGSENEAKIKVWLRGIKQQVMLHMRDKKVESPM
ncbi:MAG TPA: DUF3014 domain-containing protein [Gallionella sp.]|nr:DUF3014 domain-containing protein [Gallionella sp.]